MCDNIKVRSFQKELFSCKVQYKFRIIVKQFLYFHKKFSSVVYSPHIKRLGEYQKLSRFYIDAMMKFNSNAINHANLKLKPNLGTWVKLNKFLDAFLI